MTTVIISLLQWWYSQDGCAQAKGGGKKKLVCVSISKVISPVPIRVSAVLGYFDCASAVAVLTESWGRMSDSAQVVQNTNATPPCCCTISSKPGDLWAHCDYQLGQGNRHIRPMATHVSPHPEFGIRWGGFGYEVFFAHSVSSWRTRASLQINFSISVAYRGRLKLYRT
jgi:hypothetical protein